MPENAEKKQENSNKFQKGRSGNPKGKAKGVKNKATMVAEALLKDGLENICIRLIQEALAGNMQATKMILDRILPARKDRPVLIDLPTLKTSSDALKAISTISEAISSSKISPGEGESLSRIIDVYVRAIEVHDYDVRLKILESKINS